MKRSFVVAGKNVEVKKAKKKEEGGGGGRGGRGGRQQGKNTRHSKISVCLG